MRTELYLLISSIDDRIVNLNNVIQNKKEGIYYIVSHQITQKLSIQTVKYIKKLNNRNDVIYSKLHSKGVAKSRNNTLKYIKPNTICLMLDDDVTMCPDIFDTIKNAFLKNTDADFISFKILTLDDKDYKRYPSKQQWHTLRTLTGIGTVEIAFRSELVLNHHVRFDEKFGPGAEKYPIGEDFIFAMDIYRKNIKMLFIPKAIVKHPLGSTGSRVDNRVIFGRGALFARVFGLKAYILDFYFAIKHRKTYIKKISFFSYIKLIFSGSYDYLKQER